MTRLRASGSALLPPPLWRLSVSSPLAQTWKQVPVPLAQVIGITEERSRALVEAGGGGTKRPPTDLWGGLERPPGTRQLRGRSGPWLVSTGQSHGGQLLRSTAVGPLFPEQLRICCVLVALLPLLCHPSCHWASRSSPRGGTMGGALPSWGGQRRLGEGEVSSGQLVETSRWSTSCALGSLKPSPPSLLWAVALHLWDP